MTGHCTQLVTFTTPNWWLVHVGWVSLYEFIISCKLIVWLYSCISFLKKKTENNAFVRDHSKEKKTVINILGTVARLNQKGQILLLYQTWLKETIFSRLFLFCLWCVGAEEHLSQYFEGYLAGLSILNGRTETDKVLKCLNFCQEKLDFHAMQEMDSGMVSVLEAY